MNRAIVYPVSRLVGVLLVAAWLAYSAVQLWYLGHHHAPTLQEACDNVPLLPPLPIEEYYRCHACLHVFGRGPVAETGVYTCHDCNLTALAPEPRRPIQTSYSRALIRTEYIETWLKNNLITDLLLCGNVGSPTYEPAMRVMVWLLDAKPWTVHPASLFGLVCTLGVLLATVVYVAHWWRAFQQEREQHKKRYQAMIAANDAQALGVDQGSLFSSGGGGVGDPYKQQ